MRLTEWAAGYLSALPADMRPEVTDSRLGAAVRAAAGNGWTPEGLADQTVEAMNTARDVINPRSYGMAIMSNLAQQQPAAARGRGPAARPAVAPVEEWRASLPSECVHPHGIALELAPNQCRECRRQAGEPRAGHRTPGRCHICHQPSCTRLHESALTPDEVVAHATRLRAGGA